MRFLTLMACAAALASCTTTKTYVQSAAADPAGRQLGVCQARSELEFPDRGIIPTPGTISSRNNFTDACMRAAGFRTAD